MCGELGNSSFESTLEPVEILLPEEQKLIQIVAGHSFTIGVCIPLHGEKGSEKNSEKRKSRVIDAVSFSDEEDNGLAHTVGCGQPTGQTGQAERTERAETERQTQFGQPAKNAEEERFADSKLQQSSEDLAGMAAPKRRANPSAFGFNTAEIMQAKEKMRSSGSSFAGMTSTFAVRKSTAFTPVVERKAAVENVDGDDICFQSRAQRAPAFEKLFQAILKKWIVYL